MKRTIAFGAGNFYKAKKNDIEGEYNVVAFCDNDPKKVGTLFDGKPIISIEQLDAYLEDDILITSVYKYEIVAQLIQKGISVERIKLILPEWMKECDSVEVSTEEGIKICKDGISIILHNELEEMMYREIWYNEDYNINLQTDSIVIDIGLNVGMAALFFANKKFVSKVYAFEPDKTVYEKAIYNIELNEKIKQKIETFNVACANEDKEEEYIINVRESAGIKKRLTNTTNGNVVKVNCVDSAKVLGTIIDRHFGKENIIMKCDCEGAEYEIFYRLEETGYLNKIDAFVMEWHDGRRKEIEEIFCRNKYAYVIFNTPGRQFGKCYAVKK